MRLSSGTRINGWFAFAFLVLLVNGIASQWILAGYLATTDQASTLQDVRATLEEVLAGLRGAESVQRRFLIVEAESDLETYRENLAKAREGLDELHRLSAGDTELGKQIEAIERLARERIDLLEAGISIRRNEGFEAAASRVRAGAGERIMTEIQALVARTGAEARLGPVRVSAGARSRAARGAIAAATGSAVLLLGLAYLLIRRTLAERERAELALRASEARFRGIFERAGIGISLLDPAGRFLTGNEALERMLGYTTDEIRRLTRAELNYPGDADVVAPLFQDLVRGERDHFRIQKRYVRRDGGILWGDVTLSLIRNENNEPELILGMIEDITERKAAEEALARKATELATSNAELEQFASVASHDLQEPLRMVAMYTGLLADRYRGRLGDDADAYITFALDGVTRMQALISDLLDYSRAGGGADDFEPTDCNGVLRRVLLNLQLSIERSNAVVTYDPLPVVPAEPSQLARVFQNLIANAIKFRGDETPRIHISARQSNGEYVFSVRDNGIGIDPEYADRIFVMFQRLTRREDHGGTGIGLAICKKIVERHGGRIWVESRPGAGATFFYSIPLER